MTGMGVIKKLYALNKYLQVNKYIYNDIIHMYTCTVPV
jgi:hypothetical protein